MPYFHAFLHPSKIQFRKNPCVPNDKPLLTEHIKTFVHVIDVSHLTDEIFTFEKKKCPEGKYFIPGKKTISQKNFQNFLPRKIISYRNLNFGYDSNKMSVGFLNPLGNLNFI